MVFNCRLYLFGLDPDITLRDRRAAVLQELLHQCNVIAAVAVYLSRIELAKAMGTDCGNIQIITNKLQLLLHSSFRQRKYDSIVRDAVVDTVQTLNSSAPMLSMCFLISSRMESAIAAASAARVSYSRRVSSLLLISLVLIWICPLSFFFKNLRKRREAFNIYCFANLTLSDPVPLLSRVLISLGFSPYL